MYIYKYISDKSDLFSSLNEMSLKVLVVAMLLVGMVIFVLVAVLLHKKENKGGEEEFTDFRLDWLQRPSGPWT